MSGKNVSIFDIPPGIKRLTSQYSAGRSWYDGNLVRWFGGSLIPIGGWVKQYQFSNLAEAALASYTNGISVNFMDGSIAVKTGGVLVYSGPIQAPALLTGNIVYSRNGAYLDQSNYLKITLSNYGIVEDYSAASTILSEWMLQSLITTTSALQTAVFVTNSSTGNNQHRHDAYSQANLTSRVVVRNPTAFQMNQNGAPWSTATLAAVYRMASAYQINDGNAAENNLLKTLDTVITPPTGIDTIWFGRDNQSTDNSLRGYLRSAIILPQRLSDANLQTWSNLSPTSYNEPIRDTHAWRDQLKEPWAAFGSANHLWGVDVAPDGSYTFYNITPAGLGYNPGGISGYGSGFYGMGVYGISPSPSISYDLNSSWSLDNFGKYLVAVASQDGRLVIWDPVTPATIAQVVATAPVDNTLVIATDQRFLMLLGGKNNPRRVKWANQGTYDDWTVTATSSAGGFDIESNGVITAACKVPGGILVTTDTDVFFLEYIGAPYYYAPRRVSDDGGLLSKNALVATPFGAVWMGQIHFWKYDGQITKIECTVEYDAFYRSNLSIPQLVHGGLNQYAQEVWWFYPSISSTVPDRYVVYSYNQGEYWTLGSMTRTAWLNPVWEIKSIGVNDQIIYQQETGITADGMPRNSYAETGYMEIGEGDASYRVDRVYPDITRSGTGDASTSLNMTFKLRQAPNADERIYGPLPIHNDRGYVTVRMRARQIAWRIDEVTADTWVLGKTRFRIKQGGTR